jgi:hypothetical protein
VVPGHQGGWGSQVLFEVLKGFLSFFGPLELILYLEEFEEREPPNAESWDEPTQGSHTTRQLMDIMETLGWLHFGDSRHLL